MVESSGILPRICTPIWMKVYAYCTGDRLPEVVSLASLLANHAPSQRCVLHQFNVGDRSSQQNHQLNLHPDRARRIVVVGFPSSTQPTRALLDRTLVIKTSIEFSDRKFQANAFQNYALTCLVNNGLPGIGSDAATAFYALVFLRHQNIFFQ